MNSKVYTLGREKIALTIFKDVLNRATKCPVAFIILLIFVYNYFRKLVTSKAG